MACVPTECDSGDRTYPDRTRRTVAAQFRVDEQKAKIYIEFLVVGVLAGIAPAELFSSNHRQGVALTAAQLAWKVPK